MILFCIPFAGGSEISYYNWKKYFNKDIKLYPIKLKGRASRMSEGFYNNLLEAVDDIFDNIKYEIKNEEYAVYGHSMGSTIAYELYYKIVNENYKRPSHMFFSGNMPPDIKKVNEKVYNLPDDLFMEKVIEKGGTPKEVLESKELLELVIPILRSDFKILGEYVYKPKEEKIKCDITVFNGIQDKYTEEQINHWKTQTSGKCDIYNFQGDHFFINTETEKIADIMKKTLLK